MLSYSGEMANNSNKGKKIKTTFRTLDSYKLKADLLKIDVGGKKDIVVVIPTANHKGEFAKNCANNKISYNRFNIFSVGIICKHLIVNIKFIDNAYIVFIPHKFLIPIE